MPDDEGLADRVRVALAERHGISEQVMFGGLMFLLGGNIAVGVSRQGDLIVRLERDEVPRLLERPHTAPFPTAARRMRGWLRVGPEAQAPITHSQVGEALMKIDSADAYGRRANDLVERHTASDATIETRVCARTHAAYATALAREAIDILFQAGGASAVRTSVPIQRYQRDIQALSNRAFMAAPTALELLGRVVCGLPPNTIFL